MTNLSDKERVAQLYVDHSAAILGYLARRTGPDEAADLLGETIEIIWRRRNDLPSQGGRAAVDVRRRPQRPEQPSPEQSTQTAVRRRRARHTDSGSTHIPTEAELSLQIALEDLAPIDREIMTLSHWEGFTMAEVATLLQMHPDSVRTRYRRGRLALQAWLSIDADGPKTVTR